MKNKKRRVIAAVLTAAALSALSGCASTDSPKEGTTASAESGPVSEESSPESAENLLQPGGAADVPEDVMTEKRKLLEDMTKAVESQFPGESFSDVPEEEVKEAASKFWDSYVFSGRKSASGWEYIAGVSLMEENPLEGMSCRSDGPPSEYVTSQFYDGQFILMEKSGRDGSDLSELYDVLHTGEKGIRYMLDVAKRGNTLVMPQGTPFLRVYMVKGTIPVIEYIAVTQDEYAALKAGTQAVVEEGTAGTLLLCESREDVQKLWTDAVPPATQEMVELAKERCGYESGAPELSSFVKAALSIDIHGEIREETLGNREDIERLQEILKNVTPQNDFLSSPTGNYAGTLTLTGQDGTVQTMHIGQQGESCVVGTSWFGTFKENSLDAVWKLFSTIDGWSRYGDQIGIRMNDSVHTEEDQALTFTLENDTGKTIDYILSPIFYKKEGDSWVMLESIAGFCGVSDRLEGQEKELTVPWKGAFETRGDGTYKLEIQVAPEEGLRFAISDTFEIKK
ncbi:hypothetical protein [Clostridium transplantifaecale]|uniref:hypothetical protein n=1 Tax=Clostridium transplantifaecale TaxID=2479838 RepID=UPI000F643FB2|nr:hypothetical protein [Clostridium transplantifaecale]